MEMNTCEDESDISLLENDILEMFKSQLHTDVKIRVKSQSTSKCFDAHALILATRSPVFADLFCKTEQISSAVVERVSIRGFEILLWYIYSNTIISNCPYELIEVSKAARQLKISGVSRACKHKLVEYLVDISNVCAMFQASRYFKMEYISTKCRKIIQAAQDDELLENPGFQNARQETISTILALKNFSMETSISATIRWLQQHKVRERDWLSRFRILSLSSQGFLDLVERFPSYFTSREVACILSNILRPGIMELPPWCEADVSSPTNETEGFLSGVYEEIIENAVQVKTDCNKRFPQSHLHGRDGFEGSIVFEMKLPNSFPDQLHLVMLELAFGSSYAPLKNLELELFQYELYSKLKTRIPFVLKSTREHYYLILKSKMRLPVNHPFVFCLNLRAFGLRRWGEGSPVSDCRYRAVQIPGDIFHNMRLEVLGNESVCLTLLSDWLLFLDPIREEKRLLLTSFYFDSAINIIT